MSDNKKLCSYTGCSRPHRARSYCNGHLQMLKRGQPLVPIMERVPSDLGPAQIIDRYAVKKDGCWGWARNLSSEGYAIYSIKREQHYAHRVSYEAHNGPIPDGLFVDHMCHNRSCTNPAHLQLVTNKENHENRPGPQANSTTGVRGVSRIKRSGKYEAYLKHWGKRIRVGNFSTITEAEAAVVAKRNELFTNNLMDRVTS